MKSAYYLDTSAAMKLVKSEPETMALGNWLIAENATNFISTDFLRTELIGGTLRFFPQGLARAQELVSAINFMKLSSEACIQAAMHVGRGLGTLDALHLASALSCSSGIQGLITYDKKLIEACEWAGLRVFHPGAEF